MKKYSFDGLKRQPTWEELVRDVSAGGVPDISLPDRTATYNATMNPFVSAWEDQQKAIIAQQRAQQDYALKKPQAAPMGTRQDMDDDFHDAVSQLGDGIEGLHGRVQAARDADLLAHLGRPVQHFDIGSQVDPDEPMRDAAEEEGIDLVRPLAVQNQASGGGDTLGVVAGFAGGLGGAATQAALIGRGMANGAQTLIAGGASTEVVASMMEWEALAAAQATAGGTLGQLAAFGPAIEAGTALGGPVGGALATVAAAGVAGVGLSVGLRNTAGWVGGEASSAANWVRHIIHPEDRNDPAPLQDFTTSNIHRPDALSWRDPSGSDGQARERRRPPGGDSSAALPTSAYQDYDALRQQAGPGDYGSGLGRSPPTRNRRPNVPDVRPYVRGWF